MTSELRRRLLITVAAVGVASVLRWIPLPGVDMTAILNPVDPRDVDLLRVRRGHG